MNTTAFLDEDGLTGGNAGGINDLPGTDITTLGLISFSYKNGTPASSSPFTWNTTGIQAITSSGSAVTYSVSGDGLTLTAADEGGEKVFELVMQDTSSGLFEATLFKSADHGIPTAEDDLLLQVGFTLTDSAGATSNDMIAVFIDDDSPAITYQDGSEIEVSTTHTGNWTLSGGADGLEDASVKVPGDSTSYALDTAIQLDNGVLTIKSDGTWTFTIDRDVIEDDPKLSFTVTASDTDGDVTSRTFNTTVKLKAVPVTPETDDDPATTSPTATVDEDGLEGGGEGGIGDVPGRSTTARGELGYSFGANEPAAGNGAFSWHLEDMPALTSGGEPLNYTLSPNGRVIQGKTADGDTVIALQLNDLQQGSYTLFIQQGLDHADATKEDNIEFSVGFTITDAEGLSADGKLNLVVNDDSPAPTEDTASTDSATAVTVDVLGNDLLGGDGGTLTQVSVQGGAATGTAAINADGTVTFTPNVTFAGDAVITYTLMDRDGDQANGELTVGVDRAGNIGPTTPGGDGDPLTENPITVVDEEGLSGGVQGGDFDAPTTESERFSKLGYDFGIYGAADNGAFRWSLSDSNLPKLTTSGEAIIFRLSGDGHSLVGSTDAGDEIVIIQLTDVATGTYKVAITKPLDHQNPNAEDDLRLLVGYTVTDKQGLTADGAVRIFIDDDSPLVQDDQASTDNLTPVTVDVLANDQAGADGAGSVSATVTGGNSVGTVVVNADNTLTFTAAQGFAGKAIVDYTFTDGDGDIAHGTLKVNVTQASTGPITPETDDDPASSAPRAVVDDEGLAGGVQGGIKDAATTDTERFGSLGYDFGSNGAADTGAFRWNTSNLPRLTTGGQAVTFDLSDNGQSLVGSTSSGEAVIFIQLTDLTDGTYRVAISKPLDHKRSGIEDDILLRVGYTVTDKQGLTADGVLDIIIDDDSPVVQDDQASTDNETPVVVDVLANDQAGADGEGSLSATVVGGNSVGTVTVNDDNTLTFTAAQDFTGQAIVDYTFSDGDGDTAQGKLKVDVTQAATGPTTPESDGDPSSDTPLAVVDEDGLLGGNEGGSGDVAGTVIETTGLLNYDFGSRGPAGPREAFTWDAGTLPQLTSGGSQISFYLNGNGRSLVGFDENDNRVITVQLTDLASGSYRVVLNKPLDHTDPTEEDDIELALGYTITDSAGAEASGTLNIQVNDDSPTSRNDSVEAENNSPVTLDVLANNALGADGGHISKVSVAGGADVGTVSINPDGTLTFIHAPGFEGTATISYTLVDGDGDTASGSVKVNIVDNGIAPTTPETDGDPATTSPVTTVDEDGLAGGLAGGNGDVSGETVKTTGSLGYTFGEDGPASTGAFTWQTAGLPSLTSGGDAITFNVSANGTVLTGSKADGTPVLTVKVTDLASGSYEVVLSDVLDHPMINIEDSISLNLGYALKDGDGDVVSGKLTVNINDDMPEVFMTDPAFLEDGASGAINFATHAGADGADSVVFYEAIDGTAALDSAGNALVYLGKPLTYALSDDGKMLSAVTADGDVAFSVALSDDGTSYSVMASDAFTTGETSDLVVSTGTAAGDNSFIGYNVADAEPGNDVLISSKGQTIVREGSAYGVGDAKISAGEVIRVDFLNNAVISKSQVSWDSHQSISRYQQTLHVDGKSSSKASLSVSAFAFDADGGAGSTVPALGSGTPVDLSVSDISVFDAVGVEVTSEITLTDTGNSITVAGIQDGWRIELESSQPFQAVEITGQAGNDLSLGGMEYRSGGEGGSLDVTYELTGTDGDGDYAEGHLTLETREEDSVQAGGDGDDTITAGHGDDVIIGDDGGSATIIENGKDYNLALVLDFSVSTAAYTDIPKDGYPGYFKTRIEILREAVTEFVNGLKDHVGVINMNVVIFNDHAYTMEYKDVVGNNLFQSIIDRVNGWGPGGYTNTEDAFRKTETWFKQVSTDDVENQTIFYTDGTPQFYMAGVNNDAKVWTANTTQVTMQETVDAFNDLTQYTDVHAVGWDETPKTRTILPDDTNVSQITQYFDNTNVVGESTVILDDGTEFTGTIGEAEIVDTQFELNLALATGSKETGYNGLGNDTLDGGGGNDIIFGDTTNSDELSWTNGDTGASFAAGTHDGMGLRGVFEFLTWSPEHGDGEAPTNAQLSDYVRDNYESLLETTRTQGGDDTLRGGAGDDILIGGGGADTFVFTLADAGVEGSPATDTIVDFHTGVYGASSSADKLDLSDLLEDASEASLSDYLLAEQQGADTVLHIDAGGNISADGSNASQVIVLSDVSMSGSSDDFLKGLLENHQLDIE
ncbi:MULTISPECIES: Ig-like domain-containing protein [Halomonas]|uniref:Ig-like domain-containing protein n=1 Tax=Halomonas TaxID=2745 RepID=UPI001A8CBE2E|nr:MULTISPECIES: cadherin-like domain-containing protein [Halomonas]MBN8411794.1 tandem-95 repeat protein [Halomonas litopenaei]MBY5967608.1 tandem-95 repeat protein [Halomonas denitrificans]MBY5983112.1 tandem-95 repeat protein [Halomonas sp. DP5Y7-2]